MTLKLMTVKELSQETGLKQQRIYELIRTNKIPYTLIGDRQYRFSIQRVTEWILKSGNRDQQKER